MREIAPAVPAKNLSKAVVKPLVEVERHPSPVEIWGLVSVLPGQSLVGSK